MLCIVDDWLQALDGIAAVFMDFQKAFDRVWHDGLLYKLGLCGIKPAALSWVRSYLTDQSVSVQVRQHRSPYPLSVGVALISDLFFSSSLLMTSQRLPARDRPQNCTLMRLI